MTAPACPDDEFVRLIEEYGVKETARRLSTDPRAVYRRRNNLERKYQRRIDTPFKQGETRQNIFHPQRLEVEVEKGIVVVGSDGHYWPGPASTAHRAFVKFCREFSPTVVVMNGDALDGATISRHPPINWEQRPSLIQEIEAVQERLTEIRHAAPKAENVWTLGNHDARFETKLATVAPEYARIHGVHLQDHFPGWEPCYSLWVNDEVVIKHRFKGGIHATHNGPIWAGKTMVTGHLHSLKVTPFTDYNGTRWGVDTGTLADPNGPQFLYGEDNPKNHRSGFAVLTFERGELRWPELVHVVADGVVEFRGRTHSV